MKPEFDLTVSVACTNERHYVEPMLPTLYKAAKHISFEVILIDNVSTDGIGEMAEKGYENLRIIRNEKRLGFCVNHNIGIQNAKGRYILVLNPDILFEEGEMCLDKMVKFMDENPECGIGGCRVYNFDKEFAYPARSFYTTRIVLARRLERFFGSEKQLDKHLYRDRDINSTFECDWLSGCFLFVRKETADEIGGFDPRYPKYFEDVDICYRAHKHGWKIMYYGGTYYYHLEQRASKKLLSRDARLHIQSYIHFLLLRMGLRLGRKAK